MDGLLSLNVALIAEAIARIDWLVQFLQAIEEFLAEDHHSE